MLEKFYISPKGQEEFGELLNEKQNEIIQESHEKAKEIDYQETNNAIIRSDTTSWVHYPARFV